MRLTDIRSGVRQLTRLPLRSRAQIDADADSELESMMQERVQYLVARGWTPKDARGEAERRIGMPMKDAVQLLYQSARQRERRKGVSEMLEEFLLDVRHVFRTLRRDVRFAALSIIIVGLGIGASVTVFSVANALLMRPLPFANPGQLVWIENNEGDEGLSSRTVQAFTVNDIREGNRSFSDVAAYHAFYSQNNTRVIHNGETVRLTRVPVSQNFFTVLGVKPALGRSFTAEESTGQGVRVVMLAHNTWKTRYNSDPAIVGTSITMNDVPATIVGVLPQDFDFASVFAPGTNADLFSPVPLTESTNRSGNLLFMIGRLKEGVSVASARAEVLVLARRIKDTDPKRNKLILVTASLREHVSGHVKSPLVLLTLSVGVVMLIVCANLSNLLLVRASARQREMAVRTALGAGRSRLIRQMLTESTILSVCGAIVGLLLAFAGTRIIATLPGVNVPLLSNVHVDGAALGFTMFLAIGAGVLFGIAPALQVSTGSLSSALKNDSRGSTASRSGRLTRNGLVVAEIALACMLLVGAGLLTRSFVNVLRVDLGFSPERVSAIRADPDRNTLESQEKFVAYVDAMLETARSVPGITSAALTDGLPLGGNRSWGVAARESGYAKDPSVWHETFIHVVSDGFMQTMGIKLIAGRDFDRNDSPNADSVIIVNETLARTLWPGQGAIGKLMKSDKERRVVGVVADVRILAPEKPAGAELYLPLRQSGDFSSIQLVVRSSLEPTSIAATLRSALKPIAPNLAVNQFDTMQERVDTVVSPRRFMTVLLVGFAAFALLLALVGIYSVISFTVSHRTQEIGVRMALGASAMQVQRRIIRETLTLAATGIIIGTVVSWGVSRTLGSLLFGVSPTDPISFTAMLVVLTVVAVASGYLPARRAALVDPITALRGT